MAAPAPKPAAHVQPRKMKAVSVPMAVRRAINLTMRAAACRNQSSSGTVIAGIPRDLPDQLHESGGNSQEEKHKIEKVGAKRPVEQRPHKVADRGGCREKKRQRGILAGLHHERLLATRHNASLAARAFRRLPHQESHLGMGWLQIGMHAEFLERLGSGGANRGDERLPQSIESRG